LEDAKNVLDQFAKYLRVRVRFLDLLTEGLPPDAINRGDWLTAEEADGRFQRACELEEADVEAMAEMMNDRDGLKHAVLWTGKKMGVTVTGMRRLTATLDESLVPQGMTDARAQGLAMLRDRSPSHDEALTEPRRAFPSWSAR
jgi:hypothetical protein